MGRMRTSLGTIAATTLLALSIARAGTADSLRPDADGYIRDWIMLAPIALPDGETCAEALLKEQIPMDKSGTSLKNIRIKLTP